MAPLHDITGLTAASPDQLRGIITAGSPDKKRQQQDRLDTSRVLKAAREQLETRVGVLLRYQEHGTWDRVWGFGWTILL